MLFLLLTTVLCALGATRTAKLVTNYPTSTKLANFEVLGNANHCSSPEGPFLVLFDATLDECAQLCLSEPRCGGF